MTESHDKTTHMDKPRANTSAGPHARLRDWLYTCRTHTGWHGRVGQWKNVQSRSASDEDRPMEDSWPEFELLWWHVHVVPCELTEFGSTLDLGSADPRLWTKLVHALNAIRSICFSGPTGRPLNRSFVGNSEIRNIYRVDIFIFNRHFKSRSHLFTLKLLFV